MDICVISDLYPPEIIGGAEKHASEDCRALAERGHNVSVITTGKNAPRSQFKLEKKDGVDIYRIKPVNIYPPYEYQDAKVWQRPIWHTLNIWNPVSKALISKKLNKISPEVIHIHNYRGLSTAVFSAAGNIDAPTIHTLHDYSSLHIRSDLFNNGDIEEPPSYLLPFHKYNNKIISENVDKILSPSQFVISKYNSHGLFTDISCRKLPLGVNCSEIKNEFRDTKGLNLLFVGQHTIEKGLDILIESLSDIDCEDVTLNVLGKGPKTNELQEKASQVDNIRFHGFVSEKKLDEMYLKADFTVVPSRWYDNSPMVIYESYCRGTPVIGANIGGIPELIQDGSTGYLFEPESENDLKETILRAINKPHLPQEKISEKGRSIDDHVDELISIYESLL